LQILHILNFYTHFSYTLFLFIMKLSFELPTCNLILQGFGTDINGNSVVKLCFPNKRGFSIQTNGKMSATHNAAIGREELTKPTLLAISKEVGAYVALYGSKAQVAALRTYKA
jgi:hypothetical protein